MTGTSLEAGENFSASTEWETTPPVPSPYTFDEDVAAVDTNVRRLVSRFFDAGSGRAVETIADALVPAGRGGNFLHAMLDFSAEVCTARSPGCDGCRLRRYCEFPELTDDGSPGE